MNKLDWKNLKAIILDVDGTLYHQSKLRKKMAFQLLKHYLFRPWKVKDIFILYHFRKEREKMVGHQYENLEKTQYQTCATKLGLPITRVKAVVNKWIIEEPNQYLTDYRYPSLVPFLELMGTAGIKIVIYSDYPALQKIKAMQLSADLVVAATDPEINALKPNPKGLQYILSCLNNKASQCIFIGDREELDGQAALTVGMPFLLISNKREVAAQFYDQMIQSYTQYQQKK